MSVSPVPRGRRARSKLAFGVMLALVASLVSIQVPVGDSPARAAGTLVCNGTAIYGAVPENPLTTAVGSLVNIDGASTGNTQLTAALESTSTIPAGPANALGITSGGASAYFAADGGGTILRYDAATGTWAAFPGATNPSGFTVVAGAVDPTTGIYYFGDVGASATDPNTGHLWGFDTTTNQLISNTPLITFPASAAENNGDIAFDGAGNIYVVTSSTTAGHLEVVPGPLPRSAAQARLIQPTLLSTFSVPNVGVGVNGIAFDSTGTLYLSLSGNTGIFSIEPGTGASRSTLTPLPPSLLGASGTGLIDLASCAFPPSLSVQKNIVSRVNPTDQFTLAATGATISRPTTATTTGTATGLQTTPAGQTVTAGPALARTGESYSATETAAGTTTLSDYVSTYRCVDEVNPTNPEFPITGTGTTVSFTLEPFAGKSPSVVCTFTTAPAAPALALTKTANPTTIFAAGDAITYTFEVTNTGDVGLTGIGVNETAFTGTGPLPAPTCVATTLAPGESTQCTSGYTATAADVSSGRIDNTAVAAGDDPGNNQVTSPPATAVVIVASPALALTKEATPATVSAVGETVTYTFHVTNPGNVPVSSIAIEEGSFSGTGSLSAITCSSTTLAPGAATDCTATYTVTQADFDTGRITNDAVASGLDPSNNRVASPPADALVTVTPAPALSLTKTVNPTSGTAAGENVTYSFLVANTGNVTVTGIAVSETAFSGTGTPPAITCPAGASSLAPGDRVICTAQYTLTQADADAGHVDNTAVATGDGPGSSVVTSNDSDVVLPIPSAPALTLSKTADPTMVSAAGDAITYTFRVTNTGNVTLTSVNVTEQRFTGTGGPLTLTCPAERTLSAGASLTCTADYRATAADIAAGGVTNVAAATASDPAGGAVTARESQAIVGVTPAVVPLPPSGSTPPTGASPLAETGSMIAGWLVPLGALLAIAGSGLVITVSTRNRRTSTKSSR